MATLSGFSMFPPPPCLNLTLNSRTWRIGVITLTAILTLSACEVPKSATEYLIAGNEYFKARKYEAAAEQYQEALRREPESSTAANNLGVVLNELGRYEDAATV